VLHQKITSAEPLFQFLDKPRKSLSGFEHVERNVPRNREVLATPWYFKVRIIDERLVDFTNSK
jgi:hypothetical protein